MRVTISPISRPERRRGRPLSNAIDLSWRDRHLHDEERTGRSRTALAPDLAVQPGDDAPHDPETEAGRFLAARRQRRADGVLLENPLALVRLHSRAAIADLQPAAVPVLMEIDPHL